MNIDNTLVQKYAPLILSGLVLIIPAVNVLAQNPSRVTVLQFAALLVATVLVFPLRAPWKQVAELAGVLAAAALPFALNGELTWTNWALVAVAVVKAIATHLGVILRRDPVTDAPVAVAVPVLTTPAPDGLDVDLATQQTEQPDDDVPGRHEAV